MSGSGFDSFIARHGQLDAKKHDLERVANSKDGKVVQEIMQGKEADIQKALEAGNAEALKSIMNSLLQSEAGKNIVAQLSEIIK